jgi:uncharacterized protein
VSLLLFATDLHGHLASYRELVRLALEEADCRALVLGGDLFPRPGDLQGRTPSRPQARFVSEELGPLFRKLRVKRPEVWIGGLLGNDDLPGAQGALDALGSEGLWRSLHLERHRLGEFAGRELWIAGYSGVPVTPFRLSDWDRPDHPGWEPARAPRAPLVSDAEGRLVETTSEALLGRPSIAEELEQVASLGDMKRTICVAHSPPAGSGLGLMHGGRDIGSQALRAWIAAQQPPLTLHGHVHESPRQSGRTHAQIGATRSCNPGDSRRKLRALWIDLRDPGAEPESAG